LLAVVAGTITNIDTFSHALHTSIASATAQVGLDLKVLTTLRAIAVVGFVMMSRLKQVSFKELYASEPLDKLEQVSVPVASTNQTAMEPESELQEPSHPDELAPLEGTSLSITELAHLLKILVQQHEMTISEEQHVLLSVVPGTGTDAQSNEMRATQEPVVPEPEPPGLGEETLEEREARIERAYLELKAEGKRISGRSLAARAHIHRSTCNQWLESYQQRTNFGVPEPEEDEQGGADAPLI
jgi:hypothetical protein